MECHSNSACAPIRAAAITAHVCCLAVAGQAADGASAKPFNFEEASRGVLKPREIWPHVEKHLVPLDFRIGSDEIVVSDTDPGQRLRKVTAHFDSQELAGKTWGHRCVILLPADNQRNLTSGRLGKVVIVGAPGQLYFPVHVDKYGEPIAARTGYPTMVLSNPGTYPDGSSIERDIRVLGKLARETGNYWYNMNCQLAVVYIQAMNAFQQFLGLETISAVIGGHSKRGRSTPVAAAMDSRVAGAIMMGQEGVYSRNRVPSHLSFHLDFFQDQVSVPVFYLGATNALTMAVRSDGWLPLSMRRMTGPPAAWRQPAPPGPVSWVSRYLAVSL